MKPLLTHEQLDQAIQRLAGFVHDTYPRPPLVIVGVLTGSLVMLADLIRRLDIPLRVALIQASSYRGATVRRSELRINDRLLPDLSGSHVLVIDDIFDTGQTMLEVMQQLQQRNPASLRSAVLLRKQGRSEVNLEPDFVGCDIPDEFVVGYGLDYDDLYRNLPYVAALEPEDLG